ncbi:hypothetical protein [Streptomyces sp. NPDC051569]|uniref:hypothetical protein n=1 Tax=Streptomyces sp. NPDC051569 TaxID=3365661 RepID=UPI003796F9F8
MLRVLFVAMTLGSIGFLGWAAMLRIAIVRRRPGDWVMFCVVLLLCVTALIFMGQGDASEEPTGPDVVAVALLFLMSAGVTAHFLVADIKHFSPAGPGPGGVYAPSPGYGYGYPSYAAGATRPLQPLPPVQPPPGAQPLPPMQPTPPPPAQQPPPAQPPHPRAPRIDQVRAELDELSDLLRKGREDKEREGR